MAAAPVDGMRAGEYPHRVAFDEPMTSQSDSGDEIVDFEQAFELWSKVEPLTGKEGLTAGQINAEIDTRISFRWSPNVERINAKWRARFAGNIYNIIRPPAQEKFAHRKIELLCSSGVNLG